MSGGDELPAMQFPDPAAARREGGLPAAVSAVRVGRRQHRAAAGGEAGAVRRRAADARAGGALPAAVARVHAFSGRGVYFFSAGDRLVLEELRLLLGQYEPWRLPIYLAIVGLYLVAALVFRFGEDPDPAKEELYEALEGVMLFFVPGRWFWMALQGIVFGAA